MNMKEQYIGEIARVLKAKPDQISLYWKGRVGLFALLKAMGIGAGDEVIVPAFTCVVVPNAILYLGAKPIYVDIQHDELNPTLESIKNKVSSNTRCILVQNTFGLSTDVDQISRFAKENGILTIEDCTHGFGGLFNGRPNGTYCDAAFYSTQWNKPFSTGIGGFTLLNNPEFQHALNIVNQDLIKPSFKERKMLASLIRVRGFMLNDSTYWPLLRMYRKLSSRGTVVGSSSSAELSSVEQPSDYFMGSSTEQVKAGVKSIGKLNHVMELRIENGRRYNAFMREKGLWNYPDRILENHSFLKYPVFVKDRALFMEKAEKAKVRLGDWFLSPIHPVLDNYAQWLLNIDDFPNAKFYSTHILNLPTETTNCEKVLAFLNDNLDQLLPWEKKVN